jgi:hypothetical protein
MSKQVKQKIHVNSRTTAEVLQTVIKRILHLERKLRKTLEIERRQGVREKMRIPNINTTTNTSNKEWYIPN